MTYIFDGKKFAAEKLSILSDKISKLRKKPVLATILVGNDPASSLYVSLKKKAGESIGAEVRVIFLEKNISENDLKDIIVKLNLNPEIKGIMIQMPLPDSIKSKTKEIINTIDRQKDVDGLREDSQYLHPTIMAIIEVLQNALNIVRLSYKDGPLTLSVVGATGMVGKPLVRELGIRNKELWGKGISVIECDSNTKNITQITTGSDVIISATGKSELIKAEMVKNGAILIDVGSPLGDIEKNAYEKAIFVSPVPGGIGPVTVACLFENLIVNN